MLGYYLGFAFWGVAKGILFHYIDKDGFEVVREYFNQYQGWAIAVAGLTPIPYKVFTITAGFLRANLLVFIVASILARGLRFFTVAGLIYLFGPKRWCWQRKRSSFADSRTSSIRTTHLLLSTGKWDPS